MSPSPAIIRSAYWIGKMKFDDLDTKMRVFETSHDDCVPPDLIMVARLDGRGFTRLTKEIHAFEAPYDVRFRDFMVATTHHLMDCGFRIVYGYSQSDEISLLFHPKEDAFNRKLRKYNSILAGEASARFSLLSGEIGCFDCRISRLPSGDAVVDYFRWRQEDARRNALNSHCYWMLRKKGETVKDASDYLSNMSVSRKTELLFQNGIHFNELPAWQKSGFGVFWETYEKPAFNPKTRQAVTATRRKIKSDFHLPLKDEYDVLIKELLNTDP